MGEEEKTIMRKAKVKKMRSPEKEELSSWKLSSTDLTRPWTLLTWVTNNLSQRTRLRPEPSKNSPNKEEAVKEEKEAAEEAEEVADVTAEEAVEVTVKAAEVAEEELVKT